MGHLPKKSDDTAQTTIAPAADAASREDRHTAIFRMLGQRSRELVALLGKPELVDRFRRAAAAHYLAMASASPKERARMEAVDLRSYVAACMDAAMDGLTPDGREGWIVVRGELAAGKLDRLCERSNRSYVCKGCGQRCCWCFGGADDPRCDDCVSREVEAGM